MTVDELPGMNAAFCEAKLSGCQATAIPKSISSITPLTIILFFSMRRDYWCRIQMKTYFFFLFQYLKKKQKTVSTREITSCSHGTSFTSYCPVIVFFIYLFFWFSILLSATILRSNVTGTQMCHIFRGHSFSSSPQLCFRAFRWRRFGRWRNCLTGSWQAWANSNI